VLERSTPLSDQFRARLLDPVLTELSIQDPDRIALLSAMLSLHLHHSGPFRSQMAEPTGSSWRDVLESPVTVRQRRELSELLTQWTRCLSQFPPT